MVEQLTLATIRITKIEDRRTFLRIGLDAGLPELLLEGIITGVAGGGYRVDGAERWAWEKFLQLAGADFTVESSYSVGPEEGLSPLKVAIVRLETLDQENGLKRFYEMTREHPKAPEAFYNLTRALDFVGETAAALETALSSLEKFPSDPWLNALAGEYFWRAGRREVAGKFFRKATAVLADEPSFATTITLYETGAPSPINALFCMRAGAVLRGLENSDFKTPRKILTALEVTYPDHPASALMRLASATAEISMLGRLDEQANRLKTILSDIVPLQPHYPIYAVEGRLLFEIDTLASSVVSLLRERLTDLSAGVDPKRAALANYLLGLHGKGPFLDTISRSAENLALPSVALDPSALLNAFAQTLADWRTKLPPTIGLFRPFAALRSLQAPTPRPVETLIRENLDQRVAKLYQDALDSQKKTEAAKSSCPPSHSEIEMLAHAKLAYKNKDFRLAIEWGNQLNEAYPGRPVTETLLGDAYFYLDQEHPDHAFRHYANALALGGQLTPQGLFRYGHAAFLSGHLDAAEQAFRSALRYQPDDPHLLQTLAGLLDAKGQPREAAGCHRTAIYLGANAAALDQSYRYGVMRRDRTLQKLALERALPAASTPEAAALWRLRALDQATADRDWSLVRELLDRDGAETQTPSGIFYRLLAALEKGRKKVVAAVFKDRPLPRLLPSALGKEYAAEVGVDPLLTLMTRAAWNLVQRSPTASIAALLAREVLEERPGEPLAEATLFELACREERWRGALEQVKHLPALQPLFRQILSALQTEITTDQMPGPTELRLKKQLGLPTPRREAHEGLAASRAPLREKLPPAPEPVRGHRSSLAIRTGDAWMRRADAFYLLEEYTAALGGYQAAMNAFLPYSAKAAEAAFRAVSVAIDQEDHLEAMKTLTLALKAPFNDRESYARLYRLHLDIHPGGLGKNMAVALADCQRLDD